MTRINRKYLMPAAALLFVLIAASRCRPSDGYAVARAERGNIEVWSTYAGAIQAENARDIMSRIRGSGILNEIVADGTYVTQGMRIAAFDASNWEGDMLEAEKNLLLARADYESLVNAKIPLEIRDLETKLTAAEQKLADEKQALNDTRELRQEDLVPEYEVRQLEVKVATVESEIEGLKQTIELTKQYLHPSAIQRAQATLTSASNEYVNIQEQIDNSVVRSPCAGVAVHKPAHFSGEYRAARVGDTVYYSQTFMTVSDMSELVARCDVPEQELTRISTGAKAIISPIAFPGMQLEGKVLTVSAMAQHLPGKSGGAKFFEIVVKIHSNNEFLRSEMSAQVSILSHKAEDAVLIPRSAVWWQDGAAYCYIQRMGGKHKCRIKTGAASDGSIEVLEGLEPGQKVIIK